MAIIISSAIILFWLIHLFWCMSYTEVKYDNIYLYINILLQGYLYTGLFITAHDAMHGNISANRKVNTAIGRLCSFLFAGLSYERLLKNHIRHHTHPGTELDPDFYTGSRNFFVWWFVFIKRYVTVFQIIVMALEFNLLKLIFPEPSIWMFFVLPAVLSTFQLFFFGTYLPHRTPHTHEMLPHNSRTQKSNHLFAMLSCYFFGYHSEHHSYPETPWWKLYKQK